MTFNNTLILLARAAADVDRISEGRLVLGLGSGDMPHEFAHLGIPWPAAAQRQARLEETLQVVRPLLRGETVTFAGEHVQVDGAVLNPLPIQQPHVPILVAGGGERAILRYVAEQADACNLGAVGWAGGAYTLEDIGRKLGVLDQRRTEAGRSLESVLRTGLALAVIGATTEAAQAKMGAFLRDTLTFSVSCRSSPPQRRWSRRHARFRLPASSI